MWEALITSLFSVLKNRVEELILRIAMWCLSFVVCWLYIPKSVRTTLYLDPLPGLPDYTLVYLFYLVVATVFWHFFMVSLEVVILLHDKFIERKAIKSKNNEIKTDDEST